MVQDVGILTVGWVQDQDPAMFIKPLPEDAEDQIRGTRAREKAVWFNSSGLRDRSNESVAVRRRRRADQPGQVFLKRREDFGGRRKPCVQDVGIDDFMSPIQIVEILSDGFEESAPVETGGRRENRVSFLRGMIQFRGHCPLARTWDR
jgi:hypothetical protein